MFSSGKVVWKNTEALRGEDDFSTTPAGLDLAWTKRTRVTFACGLVNSGYEIFLYLILYETFILLLYHKHNIEDVWLK